MSNKQNWYVGDIPICDLTGILTLLVKRIVHEKIFENNISIIRLVRHSIKPYKIKRIPTQERILYNQCSSCNKSKRNTFSKRCQRCAALNRHKENKHDI